MSLKFQINHPYVVAENFDDEVIAINLETGNYYSMANSGAAIWALVSAGASFNEIMYEVCEHYAGEPAAMAQAVQQFVAELQSAQLIVTQANGVHAMLLTDKPSALSPNKAPFVPPILSEYNDMQDLLLLDPIHEVDDTGWPKRKAL